MATDYRICAECHKVLHAEHCSQRALTVDGPIQQRTVDVERVDDLQSGPVLDRHDSTVIALLHDPVFGWGLERLCHEFREAMLQKTLVPCSVVGATLVYGDGREQTLSGGDLWIGPAETFLFPWGIQRVSHFRCPHRETAILHWWNHESECDVHFIQTPTGWQKTTWTECAACRRTRGA